MPKEWSSCPCAKFWFPSQASTTVRFLLKHARCILCHLNKIAHFATILSLMFDTFK